MEEHEESKEEIKSKREGTDLFNENEEIKETLYGDRNEECSKPLKFIEKYQRSCVKQINRRNNLEEQEKQGLRDRRTMQSYKKNSCKELFCEYHRQIRQLKFVCHLKNVK